MYPQEEEKIADCRTIPNHLVRYQGIPCIDCLIFPICINKYGINSTYSSSNIYKLLKCELLRNFLINSNGPVIVACQGDITYKEVNLNFDRADLVAEYFNNKKDNFI